MQLKKYVLLIFLAALYFSPTKGQDFHYTQYFMSPLGVNPALAGAYNGSYRINGIFRDQYGTAAINPFRGFSINVDAPIVRGIRKQDWIGVGLRIEQNKSGALGQNLNFYGLGVAYHLALDKKQTSIITLGAQYGTGGYTYDPLSGPVAGNPGDTPFAIVNGTLGPDGEGFNAAQGNDPNVIDGGSLNDLAVGGLYRKRNPKAGSELQIGVAVEGILGPNRGAEGQDIKGIGISGFGSYEFTMNKRTSLTSGAYYYSLEQASAINVNSILNYKMKPGNELILHGGLGTRSGRAALIFLGATISGVRVGLGYDLDIGASTPATDNRKSIELGVTYIGKIYKKPKPKPIIYCPRL